MNLRRVTLRGAVLAVGLASLALLASGCGGGSKAPSVASLGTTSRSKTTSASAPLTPQQRNALNVEYAACLNAHGVVAHVVAGAGVITDVSPSTEGRVSAAQTICRKLLPEALLAPTAAESARMLALLLKFAQCMRAHGVLKFPDPTSNGISIGPDSGIDPNSPQFQKAQKVCAKYSPGGS